MARVTKRASNLIAVSGAILAIAFDIGWCLLVENKFSVSYRSGLVVARLPAAQKVPRSNRAADKFLCFSRKLLQYAALGTGCTLTALPRSTQP